MDIREFVDLEELASFLSAWVKATGLSAAFTDGVGEVVAGDYNLIEKGSAKQTGIYTTNEGTTEFSFPISVKAIDEVVLTIIGGSSLVEEGTDAFEKLEGSVELIKLTADSIVNQKYFEFIENKKMTVYGNNLEKINSVIDRINDNSKKLTKIASKQGILALNSAIEAARLGTAGASFSILAKQESDLSKQSGEIYEQIGEDINYISDAVNEMNYAKDHDGEAGPTINVEELLLEEEI